MNEINSNIVDMYDKFQKKCLNLCYWSIISIDYLFLLVKFLCVKMK